MNFFGLFKKNPENRTQFFIVMGFIILPVLAMVYVFVDLVANDSTQHGGERLKIPPSIMQNLQEQNQSESSK